MSEPTEACPCLGFTSSPKKAKQCICGDYREDHAADGTCLVQHRIDEPYNPELTQIALDMAQEWFGKPNP